LKISKGGSGYCDTCVSLQTCLEYVEEPTKSELERLFLEHKTEAEQEFFFYRYSSTLCSENPENGITHIVFDFAEKCMLPSYKKEPGSLHFVSKLKFDLFGVSSSNLNRSFIFGLPEGHWPSGKTANQVLSMIELIIQEHKTNPTTKNNRRIRFHADNCGGQNKNRFVLFYCIFLSISGMYDTVELCFMIPGHTKNICDCSFGHCKRCFRSRNVLCPADMMKVIEESSKSTTCISSTRVTWKNWKECLSSFFKIPTTFKITSYQCFIFKNTKPGIVHARKLSSSVHETQFNLLQDPNVSVNNLYTS